MTLFAIWQGAGGLPTTQPQHFQIISIRAENCKIQEKSKWQNLAHWHKLAWGILCNCVYLQWCLASLADKYTKLREFTLTADTLQCTALNGNRKLIFDSKFMWPFINPFTLSLQNK